MRRARRVGCLGLTAFVCFALPASGQQQFRLTNRDKPLDKVAFDAGPAKTLARLNGPVSGVQFSGDGSKLLSYGGGKVRLWSATTFEQIGTIEPQDKPQIVTAQFSPDSKRLLIAAGRDVSVWNAASVKRVVVMRHETAIRWATFRPDSSRVVTAAADDRVVRVWNAGTGELEARYEYPAPVWYVAVTPDGANLMAVVRGRSELLALSGWRFVQDHMTSGIFVRDLRSRQDRARREITYFTGPRFRRPPGHNIAISEDGRKIATVNFRLVIVWDPVTGRRLGSMDTLDVGTGTDAIAFTADGDRVLTADGFVVHLWDASTGHLLSKIPVSAEDIILSSARPLAAIAAGTDGVRVWDFQTERVIFETKPVNLWEAGSPAVAFSPDGRRLAVGYPQDAEITVIELP